MFALIFRKNVKTEHSSTLACCVWPDSHNDLNLLANSESHSCVCSLELYGSTVIDPSLEERLSLLCALFILKRDLWVFKGLRRILRSNCDALVNKNTWGFLSYLQLFLSLETSVGWLIRICKFLHNVLNHVSILCRRTKHYLILFCLFASDVVCASQLYLSTLFHVSIAEFFQMCSFVKVAFSPNVLCFLFSLIISLSCYVVKLYQVTIGMLHALIYELVTCKHLYCIVTFCDTHICSQQKLSYFFHPLLKLDIAPKLVFWK